MKKIFLLVFAFVMCKIGYAQYPMTQFIGTDSAIVVSKGAMQSRFVNVVFADTTTANSQRIKQYPGAMIYAAGKLWYRNATATGWVELTSTSTDTNIYNSDGTLTGPRTLNGNNDDLTFDNMAYFSVNANPSGQVRFYQGSNNNILMRGDTTAISRRLSYNTNLGSSFTKHSLIDKNYVDSSFSLNINGTTNYLPKFTSSSAIGNSQIFDNGTNVGIGTATPSHNLTVTDNSTTTYIVSKAISGQNAYLSVAANNGTIGTTSLDIIQQQDGTGFIYNRANMPLLLGTNNTERIRITPYGNVGIGTSSPEFITAYRTLQVTGGSTTTGGIFTTTNSDETVKARFLTQSGQAAIGTVTNHPVLFLTNDTERMRLDASGNLGIGTSSPAYKLDVNGDLRVSTIANATTDTDRFIVSDGGVIKYRTGSEVLSDIGGAAASSISGTTNYIPKFTSSSAIGNSQIFDNGSAVGIGTNTPTFFLDLQRAGGLGIRVQNTSNTDDAYLQATTTLGSALFGINATGQYLYNGNAIPIWFATNGSERMRLDASGNLLVATTSPSYNAAGRGNITIGGSSSSILGLQVGGVAKGFLYHGGTNLSVWNAAIGSIEFGTNDALRATLDASGNLGLGVTPSAWASPTYRAFQIGSTAALFSASGQVLLDANSYVSSAFLDIYSSTGFATRYQQISGQHRWFTAPSGTAGNAISFTQAMTLDASGNLLVGGTSVYGATITSYGSATRSGGLGIRNSAGTAAGGFYTYASGSGGGSTDISVESTGFMQFVTASTERMRITSGGELLINTTSDAGDFKLQVSGNAYVSGSVGIGITSPVTKTHIQQGLVTLNTTNLDNGTAVGLSVTYPDVTISGGEGIALALGMNGRGRSYIANLSLTANKDASEMLFYTEGSGVIGERMRITSGGNVGIGTTNPQSRIHALLSGSAAAGPTGTVAVFQNSTPASNSYITLLGAFDSESGIVFTDESVAFRGKIGYNNSTEFMYFQTDGSERMRITSGGNVGIGTTSPGTRLEASVSRTNGTNVNVITLSDNLTGVSTAGFGTRIQGLSNNNAVVSAIGFENGGTGTNNESQLSFYTQNTAGALTRQMMISSTGNVGIGTTAPTGKLDISAGTNLNLRVKQLTLDNFSNDGVGITFTRTSTDDELMAIGVADTDKLGLYSRTGLILATGGSSTYSPTIERMRITDGGNVGIGTTSPAYKLDVSGDGRFNILDNVNNAPSTSLIVSHGLNSGSVDAGMGASILFQNYSTIYSSYQSSARISSILNNTTDLSAGLAFYYNNSSNVITEGMRLNYNGEVLINTTSDAGDYKLQVNGNTYTNGTLTTAAPSGGTAKPWKLGNVATVSPTSPDRTIEVEIDGTTYYIHAKTTNN